MDGNGQYPPPDFGCPPPNSFMMPPPNQQSPRSSSFHPSMWDWNETPSDPWAHGISNHGSWRGGPPPGSGNFNNGPGRPHRGQHFSRGWNRGRGYNNGSSNNFGKKKFKKEPEHAYFCDTCDRGFKTEENYSEHISQHTQCTFPDCKFTAHEKIVNIHWRNSHAPGAKRIKLDTQEEITKWREERRRNYPTLSNIEKKMKVQDDREDGGGVLDTAQFGRMRGRGRGRGNNRFQRGARGGHWNHGRGAPEQPPPVPPATRDRDPLGALVNDEPDSDKEEPSGTAKQGGLAVPPKQMSAGLGALIANYGSLTESESDEEPQALPIQRANQQQENQALPKPFPQGPHDAVAPGLHRGRGGRGARGRGRGDRRGRGSQMAPPKRATLLEMLLAPDIRHERNVLLQCVRYVVRSAFFGLEGKPQDRQASTSEDDVLKGERRESMGQGVAEGPGEPEHPQSARAANEEERQTGSTETAAVSTQDVSAEDPQVDSVEASETELDASGDKSGKTGQSEQTAVNPDSEETQSGAKCVLMAEETQSDKDIDVTMATTEEVPPAGVYDDDVWEF